MNKITSKYLTGAIISASLAFLPADDSFAQTSTSPYSIFGIGEIDMGNYGENSGMAGLGIGFIQENTLNYSNPASLASVAPKTFIFEGSFFGKFSQYRGQGNTSDVGTGNVQRIAIGFRAAKNWALSFGFAPISSVGYKIKTDVPIEGTSGYTTDVFSGEGGINKLYWSNAFNLTKNLSFGVNGSVIFGTINHLETDDLWTVKRQSRGQKAYIDFGLQYLLMLNSTTRLTVGAVGGYETEMKMYHTKKAYDPDGYLVVDDVKASTKQSIPEFYGVGFTINKRNRLVGGIDYRFQKWSRATSSDASVWYKDMHKLTAGMSFTPRPTGARRYTQAIKYQAGVSVNNSYLKMGDRTPPLNYTATLGAAFPMRNNNTLHFSMEYGKNGTSTGNRNAIREDYVKFTFGFSFKEAWFFRYKYD